MYQVHGRFWCYSCNEDDTSSSSSESEMDEEDADKMPMIKVATCFVAMKRLFFFWLQHCSTIEATLSWCHGSTSYEELKERVMKAQEHVDLSFLQNTTVFTDESVELIDWR